MQLAAPSLPVTPSPSSGATPKDDSISSLLTGRNSKKVSASFEQLMPDAKSSAPSNEKDKTAAPTDDRAAAEASVIFSGWLQMAAPTDAQPVAISPKAASDLSGETTADAPAATTDLAADCTNTAVGALSAPNVLGAGTTKPVAANFGSTKGGSAFAARFSKVAPDATTDATANDLAEGFAPVAVKAALAAATTGGNATTGLTDLTVTADQTAVGDLTSLVQTSMTATAAPVSFAAKTLLGKAMSALKTDGEKIAPTSGEAGTGLQIDATATDKNFLSADSEGVDSDVPTVGIDAAKPSADMPATFSHRSLSAANDRSMLTAFSTDASTATTETTAASAAADAHRAVDAVLSASERLTTSGQGVNLQFSLGGADLAVRVEMRGGELHATFRTNSPELRAALSSEWQAAASQDAASPLRMVEPVFASANPSNTGDFSQSASSQQRDAGSRQTSPNGTSFSRSFGGESSDDSSSQQESRQPRSFFGANQHLHVFA